MLRQQGCLLVHVTSSFLVLGLKGGFTERPCRIRTLDLHRIYSMRLGSFTTRGIVSLHQFFSQFVEFPDLSLVFFARTGSFEPAVNSLHLAIASDEQRGRVSEKVIQLTPETLIHVFVLERTAKEHGVR